MADIIFNIDNAKIPRILAAMKGLYPIPVDEAGEPTFTDSAWGRECLRQFMVRTVSRWETKVAKDAANVPQEDDLVV